MELKLHRWDKMGGAIATLTLMLAGCSNTRLPWQQEQVAINPASTTRLYTYQCSNGQSFGATLLPGRALLQLPNQPEIILTQGQTSSNTYTNETTIFNADPNNAFVEINGQRTYQSCTTSTTDQASEQSPTPGAASSPAPTASPSTQPNPSNQPNQPNPSNQTAINCKSANFFADLNWVQGQPLMTFGDGRSANLATNAAVTVAQTANGGTIYTTTAATAARMVIYANGSCVLQVITSNGTTTVNESGQVTTGNVQDSQTYESGFDRGYRIGEQNGRNYGIYKYGYDPNRAFGQVVPTGNASYDEGFRRGFYAGFDAGFASITGSNPNPNGSNPINGLW